MTMHFEGEAAPTAAAAPTVPAASKRRGRTLEAIVLATAFLLVNLAGARWQKPFPFEGNEGWEGAVYLSAARQFAAGHVPVAGDAPAIYRLGAPFLAATVQRETGLDFLASFRVVNGVANALILGLLVVWLRRFLPDWRIRAALGLAFLLQWDTPVRWMYFFPPHTDPCMWVFMLAGLIAVDGGREQPTAGKIALVTTLTFVGVWFREIVLVIALIYPFVGNPIRAGTLRSRWREVLPRLLPLATGLVALAAVRRVARSDNAYSFAWTALHYLYAKPWPAYLLSWFLAFGPILWLAIFQARRSASFLAGRQHLAAYLLVFTVLADMGGTDTERFLYWTMPVVYLLIGRALEEARSSWPVWLLTALAGTQLVADRAVFWPAIPEYPNLVAHAWPVFTPFGRNIPFDDLYTDTAPRLLSFVSLVEYLAFGAALGIYLLLRRQPMRLAAPSAS